MSKNPGPYRKFRTQIQSTYTITYLMSKNPSVDQKFSEPKFNSDM